MTWATWPIAAWAAGIAIPTLLIAGPMLAVNIFSSFPYTREIRYHYSSLVLVGISLATVEAIAWVAVKKPGMVRFLVGLVVASSLAATVAWGPSPISTKYHSGVWPLQADMRQQARELVPPVLALGADEAARDEERGGQAGLGECPPVAGEALGGGAARRVLADDGDPAAAFGTAAKTLEAEYPTNINIHAPMEPMNATAEFKGDILHIYSGNQFATRSGAIAAGAAGIDPKFVVMHQMWLGGGFGRRLDADMMVPAVQAAKATTVSDRRALRQRASSNPPTSR